MKPIVRLAPVRLLAACGSPASGPAVQVMSGKGQSTEVFAADNAICRSFARGQTDGGEGHANTMQLLTAVVPAVLGAGIGAAFGGVKGVVAGGALGAAGGVGYSGHASGKAQASLQQRYDMAYASCQQTRGNWLPAQGAGR